MSPRLRPTKQERQRSLWDALEIFIFNNCGWVTSEKYRDLLRFEAEPGSALPGLLRAKGHDLRNGGTAQRFLPQSETVPLNARGDTVVREHLVAAVVEIWELRLP